jgi:hypothetical protein
MYLRTNRRKNKDGSVVEYFQLAHNERHPVTRKPVAKIIHNFGRTDQLDREQLVRLCRSIARVCGLTVVDPYSDDQQQVKTIDAYLAPDLKIDKTVTLGTRLKKTGGAKPLFLTVAPAGQTLGTTAEIFPEAHH